MGRFLPSFTYDRISFWIGFFAATLLWWLLQGLRPLLKQLNQARKEKSLEATRNRQAGVEASLRSAIVQSVQSRHLAAPLFTLDDILIPPRVLVPPPSLDPTKEPYTEDVAATIIPFLVDWPELGVVYQTPTVSLPEALAGGSNLILIGELGSGKTTALGQLALQLSRREVEITPSIQTLPIYIRAYDLIEEEESAEIDVDWLSQIIARQYAGLSPERLAKLLSEVLASGRAIFLFDDFDELPETLFDHLAEVVLRILTRFAGNQCVVAASHHYLGRFLSVGFSPVAMAPWSKQDKIAFLSRWERKWYSNTEPLTPLEGQVDPALLTSWLTSKPIPQMPIDVTLAAWSAFAGDASGAAPVDHLRSYVRRMTHGQEKKLPALEVLASQAYLAEQPFFSKKEAKSWLKSGSPGDQQRHAVTDEALSEEEAIQSSNPEVRLERSIAPLEETGLVIPNSRYYGFIHPVIMSFLAGQRIPEPSSSLQIDADFHWSVKIAALGYACAANKSTTLISKIIDGSKPPLYQPLIQIGRWLPTLGEDSAPRVLLLRKYVSLLNDDRLPLSLRAKALTAVGISNSSGTGQLLNKLLASDKPNMRFLGVLGCGFIQDAKNIPALGALIQDPLPHIQQAAVLALAATGSGAALDIIARALLEGDEGLRQAAAEALATDPQDGYETLREGATLNDLLVRRAVIFGLKRANQPWSIQLIEKMQIEDAQWVVKTAAAHALETLQLANPRIPKPHPPLTETPWLISFASELGIGVTKTSALDLVLQALRTGNQDQKLAASELLRIYGDSSVVLDLYHALYGSVGELQEATYWSLWFIASKGIELPPPAKFGLGVP